jgi:hypothetical protein
VSIIQRDPCGYTAISSHSLKPLADLKGKIYPSTQMNFFSKLRRFPEFHAVIASLSSLSKAEATIIEGQMRAFGDEFRRYASSQKEGFVDALNGICTAGTEQVKIERETLSNAQALPRDLQPLLALEADIAQWRQLSHNFDETAAKSRAAADKADAALQKAIGSSRQKAEQTCSAAKRKAETDESSAADQKAALDKREEPFRRKFLESFVTPLAASIEVRYKSAERVLALTNEFQSAADQIALFEDPMIERLQKRLEDLNQVVID